MGCTQMHDSVYALARKLSKEYTIDIEPGDYNVLYAGYVGTHATSEDKKTSFIKMLDTLQPVKPICLQIILRCNHRKWKLSITPVMKM